MPHDSRTRRSRLAGLALAAVAAVLPTSALGQTESGGIFNEVFNVGGVGDRGADFRGSVGCGGTVGGGTGGGASLTQALNDGLGDSVSGENGIPIEERRDLWRLCDNLYAFGGAWTTDSIAVSAESKQSEGLAPAGLFGQTDMAKNLGAIQAQAVAARIQQIQAVARREKEGSAYAVAGRSTDRSDSFFAQPFAQPASLALASDTGSLVGNRAPRTADGLPVLLAMAQRGLSAGDVGGIEGLGTFISGRYHRLDSDTTTRELGGTTNGGGVTLGIDYLREAFLVGAAFGYSHLSTEFDQGFGNSKLDDYAFMGFGSWFATDRLSVDTVLRASILRFDQTKNVPTFDAGPDFDTLSSSPNGWSGSGELALSYDQPITEAIRINPYARIRVLYTAVRGFREEGGDGSLNLEVENQTVTSVPLSLGASASWAISTGLGIISPYVRGEYHHEFNDQVAPLRGFLLAIPDAQFRLDPDDPDRDYGTVGGGIALTLPSGWAGFADYDALVGYRNLDTHTVTVGLRKEI